MAKINTKAKQEVDFEILHIGLIDAVICTRLPIEEAARRLNAESPSGIKSGWSFDGKRESKSPCPDGQGKTHYRLYC